MYTLHLTSSLLRRFNRNYSHNSNRLISLFRECENRNKFVNYRKKIAFWVKEQGVQVAEACTRQFEFVIAQRIRRSVQVFHLYTRIWDEVALKEFMKSWRFRLIRNTRHFLISAIGVSMYNWDRERISDSELNNYKREIEDIHRLRDSTVVCATCHCRIVIDVIQPGIKYCTCHGVKPVASSNENQDGWQPYIEREDMLIWRKEEPNSGGLFAYKVYGTFSDVTAEDFLQVQIDVDYRKEWDPTARELEIIDTDPTSTTSSNNSTDVIYWEMIWPRLFANRDYVYQRRWVVDNDKGLIVIISRVTDHPGAPTRPGIYRVTTYWSYMVIRPYTEFHQPGIEFGLTYFDDPGVNIPSAVTTWVAMAGLPDFLIRMRQASKDYQKYKLIKQDADDSSENYTTSKDRDISPENIVGDKCVISAQDDPATGEDQQDSEQETDVSEVAEKAEDSSDTKKEEDRDSIANSTPEKEQGFLHYFFLTRLFA